MHLSRTQRFLAVSGMCALLFGILFKFLMFPKLLEWQIHKKINLKPGSDVRALWSKVPFAIDFQVYLFNVTNPEDIKNGKKPKLREIGPYYFEERHEKADLIDGEENDSVEYATKSTFYFKPEKSGGLTGEEELILPHIFMLAMVMATVREKPSALPVVSKAINSIFKNPDNVFVKATAMDLMFRGLPIDCSVTDFAGAAACSMLRNQTDDLIVEDPNHFRFAILGAKNGTTNKHRVKVLRGVKSQSDIGRVVAVNGKTNISTWNDTTCDAFNGTDGYVFPPYINDKEDVMFFATDLCRSLSANNDGKQFVSGLPTTRYSVWLGDPNTNPAQKCFCPPSGCLKAGVMDLHKCVGIPLVASHPHFYRADKAYWRMVYGLNPKKEKHATFLDFELFSGTVMQARKRLQFNLMLHKLDKFKIMKNFPDVLLPLFWFEQGLVIPDTFAAGVKKLQKIVTMVFWMAWLFIGSGLSFLVLAGFLYCRDTQKAKNFEGTKSSRNENNVNNGFDRTESFDINPMRPAPFPATID